MNVFSYIMGSVLVAATLIFGFILLLKPPKKVKEWYGESQKLAAKNTKNKNKKAKQKWVLSHNIIAISLIIYGFLSILAFALTLVFAREYLNDFSFLRILFGFLFALVGVFIWWATMEMELARLGKKEKKVKQPKPVREPKPANEKPAKAAAPVVTKIPADSDVETVQAPIVEEAEPIEATVPETATEAPAETTPEVVQKAETVTVTETIVEIAAETPAEPVVETIGEVVTETAAAAEGESTAITETAVETVAVETTEVVEVKTPDENGESDKQ